MWRFDEAFPFERFRLHERGERFPEWAIKATDDLNAIAAEVCERSGDVFFLPHALHFSGRTDDYVTQFNAVSIDLDTGGLDSALEALSNRGITPHFVTETQPGRWQLTILLNPIRTSKRSRPAILARIRSLMVGLSDLTDADRNAAKPGQLFRVPGTLRTINGETVEVRIIQRGEHKPYSIGQLEAAIGETRSTLRGYTAPTPKRGSVLGCPALAWIRGRSIAPGHRNKAAVAISYAANMDGLTEAEALDLVMRMLTNAGQTPAYPQAEAADVVRSCYRRPKGLDWRVLETIVDTTGETMPPEVARSVLRAMPRVRQRHTRKPAGELLNQPWCESFARIMGILATEQRAIQGRPVVIRAVDLCEAAEVSPDTFHHRILPVLRRLGVYRRTCAGRRTGSYNLAAIPRRALTPYVITGWSPLKYAVSTVVKFWQRARAASWERFKAILERLRALVTQFLTKYPAFDRLESDSQRDLPHMRGPPTSSTVIVASPESQGSDFDTRPRPALEGVTRCSRKTSTSLVYRCSDGLTRYSIRFEPTRQRWYLEAIGDSGIMCEGLDLPQPRVFPPPNWSA